MTLEQLKQEKQERLATWEILAIKLAKESVEFYSKEFWRTITEHEVTFGFSYRQFMAQAHIFLQSLEAKGVLVSRVVPPPPSATTRHWQRRYYKLPAT